MRSRTYNIIKHTIVQHYLSRCFFLAPYKRKCLPFSVEAREDTTSPIRYNTSALELVRPCTDKIGLSLKKYVHNGSPGNGLHVHAKHIKVTRLCFQERSKVIV